MHITGACHCLAIRYEADIDPALLRICHCTDCQRLSGAPFRANVRALPGTFRVTAGTPRIYTKTAESGARREQAFCEACGTGIYATSSGPEPRVYNLRFGSIDQRDQLPRAVVQIWTRSRLPWINELAEIPAIEKQG